MRTLKKLALAGAVVSMAVFTAGCASRYHDRYDGYYDGYRAQHWGERRDRHDRYDRDDWRRDHKRVRVCDADGSDCHWEYRER